MILPQYIYYILHTSIQYFLKQAMACGIYGKLIVSPILNKILEPYLNNSIVWTHKETKEILYVCFLLLNNVVKYLIVGHVYAKDVLYHLV